MIYHATCRDYHKTVAEAHACSGPVGYGGEPAAPYARPRHASPARPASSAARDVPATPPQVRFVRILSAERDVPVAGRTPEEGELLERAFDILGWRTDEFDSEHDKFVSKREAMDIISKLKSLPKKAKDEPGKAPVEAPPAGRYAITNKDGTIAFIQVDRPIDGRWKGYIFTKMLIGSPGDWTKVRMPQDRERQVWEEINKDVRAATVLFGRKSKTCGRCHSPLSHVRSRAAGYGKHCADLMGWWYPSMAEARQILDELGIDIEAEQLALDD